MCNYTDIKKKFCLESLDVKWRENKVGKIEREWSNKRGYKVFAEKRFNLITLWQLKNKYYSNTLGEKGVINIILSPSH